MAENKKHDYYEIFVQNVQKGEIFDVKLLGNPNVYSAIPLIPGRFQNEKTGKFLLKVLAPESKEGVYEYSLDEIEWADRKS
ncbi:MAG TPA: hypothetical protein VJ919_08845 [Tangfeifania sp.]|nr:hypothetical protein [Tangfeifania sp.]